MRKSRGCQLQQLLAVSLAQRRETMGNLQLICYICTKLVVVSRKAAEKQRRLCTVKTTFFYTVFVQIKIKRVKHCHYLTLRTDFVTVEQSQLFFPDSSIYPQLSYLAEAYFHCTNKLFIKLFISSSSFK